MQIYQLYTTDNINGSPVLSGTFSSLENALKYVDEMKMKLRKSWVEIDFMDEPSDDQNIVWRSDVN